ncbi:MAG TPA: DUF4388 domain-containing protein [Polyangiaceae bacterium]|nr:DUF4388 domain-containing protein [Polyangiaceae bacterium]
MDDRAPSVVPVASAVKDGFSASLSGACLPDLVQMACLSRTDGAFRVISDGRIGYLFFRQGQVVHAVIDDLTGLRAALELLKWNTGTFEPSNMSWPNQATIEMGWQHLLLQAARESDESARRPLRATASAVPKKESPVVRPSNIPIPSGARAKPADAATSTSLPGGERRSRPTGVPSAGAPRPLARPDAPSLSPPEARTVEQASAAPAAVSSQGAPASGSSVRVDAQGTIVSGRGASEELAEIATYSARLADLIGEAFGMEGFSALESVHEEHRRLIHRDPTGAMVALTAPPQAELSSIRQKFGL